LTIRKVIKEILKKHINSVIYVVWQDFESEKIKFAQAILRKVLPGSIVFDEFDEHREEYKEIELPFDDWEKAKILHIYNRYHIDILKGRETKTLSYKFKFSMVKHKIIKNLKPFLNRELHIVYKTTKQVIVVKGMFSDMGIMGLTVKVAPFYNNELIVAYDQILNIYTFKEDLIDVKIEDEEGK
jgi:hypothetical protein